MADYISKLLPRFRYGVIQPRANEEVSRARSYQLYKLLPLDFIEIATGLGLENYTEEGVEKAIKNYWTCVDRLVKEKVDHIIFSGAPISAVLTRTRVLDLLKQTKEKTGITADAPLEALLAALKHLGLTNIAVGSRWADKVNNAIIQYLKEGGIQVLGINQKKSVGIGFLRHEPGRRFGNGPRSRSGSRENLARGPSHLNPRRRRHGAPRHPRHRGRIWQTGVHQHEHGGVERLGAPRHHSARARLG